MNLPKISVNKPVATAMVFLAVLLFGLVSLTRLPLDVMPAMELPSLTVITVYPGASADEVEEQVSRVLEAVLSGSADLQKIKSVSRENVSMVSLAFNWGSDITLAANNTRDLMELVKSRLPEGAREPIIYKVNSSMMPVQIYSISAKDNYNALENIIEDEIANPIRKVEGVGTVIYLGQPEREIKINIDPARLDAYNLSIPEIAAMLKAENISIPGGSIKTGTSDLSVRIPSRISSVQDMEMLPLVNFMGRLIRLSDVATIEDGYLETDEFARSAEGMGAALMIQKQSGRNSLEVVKAVRLKMKEILPSLPDDVIVSEVLGQDEVITQSVKSLTDTLWWALLFVIIVVVAFLRDWKSSLIVFLTIPVSLVTAFIYMYAAGWTINIFSLLSLIIAIGMVVDDAIVVLENITKHISRGERPREAAIFAANEMGLAVVASTATVLVVFIPLIFVGGVVGIFFKQLAILTTVTLVASLIAALTLTPMIASLILRMNERKNRDGKRTKFFKMTERQLVRVENSYSRVLGWAVHHKTGVIVSVLLLLAAAVAGTRLVGTDYLPMFDAGDVIVVFQTPIGTSSAETDRVAMKVMKIMEENIPEMVPGSLAAISGQTRDGILTTVGFTEGKNAGTVLCHLTLPNKRNRTANDIGEILREKVASIPEIEKFHVTAGNILEAAVLGNEKPIEVRISGKDLELLDETSDNVRDCLLAVSGLKDVESTADAGKQEYEVIIDRIKASSMGLNSAMIALQIRQSIYGAEAGVITEGSDDYDIMIRYAPEYRDKITSVGNIMLSTLMGTQVRLSEVADIRAGFGPLEIKRESQQRYVTVSADLRDISLGDAETLVENALADINIPQGVEINLGGQIKSRNESFNDLSMVLVIGIILVYMVMAALFESLRDPFVIMMAVPFTIIGIVASFLLTGTTLSVTTFIGIIMLAGIVVKNGIILVDYTNLLRNRGLSLYEAIQDAGRSRLRPVVMTSLTVILAMVPLAFSKGMGYEMFSPLAVTMIGGLLFSMLITLIVVPVFYAVFNHKN